MSAIPTTFKSLIGLNYTIRMSSGIVQYIFDFDLTQEKAQKILAELKNFNSNIELVCPSVIWR